MWNGRSARAQLLFSHQNLFCFIVSVFDNVVYAQAVAQIATESNQSLFQLRIVHKTINRNDPFQKLINIEPRLLQNAAFDAASHKTKKSRVLTCPRAGSCCKRASHLLSFQNTQIVL